MEGDEIWVGQAQGSEHGAIGTSAHLRRHRSRAYHVGTASW